MKDEGRGESDWSKSMQGERMPGRCQLTPSLPFFLILCAFFIPRLCLSSSFLLLTFLSLIFSLSLWGLEASRTAPSWNSVWKHPGIYQLLLNLLSDCQMPHHSCAQNHTHTHTHTPPGRVKQSLFSQKIDIKKRRRTKNTLLIRSWGDCRKSSPVWWQNGKHMSKPSSQSAKLAECFFRSLLCYNKDSTTPSHPWSLSLSKLDINNQS